MAKQDIDVEGWIKRWDAHRARRSNWDSQWREVNDFFYPRPDDFTTGGMGSASRNGGGEKRTDKIFDITAPLALDRGAGGLASLTIPQQRKWHKLRATDEELNKDPAVKKWFEEVERRLFAWRGTPDANYYTQAHEGFMSTLAFGNHCQFTDASPSGGMRYRGIHIGQVWVDVDHQRRVDTVFRLLTMSAKAAQQQWGHLWGDSPPEKIKAALEQGKADLFDFLHVVAPRKNVDPERLGPEAMPWLSLHIFPEQKMVIDEGGFEEFPFQYPRWSTSPNENYGRGPGMMVLPTVKVMNQVERTTLRTMHMNMDPPIMLEDDGVFGAGSRYPRFEPGRLHYGMLNLQGNPRAVPFNPGIKLAETFETQEAKRRQVQSAFNNDLFRILVESDQMTATEILERVKEKGQLLAPVIGRLQSEWFGPQIHCELGILGRQRLLPPMPPVMIEAGASYEVEYDSPATQMVRSEELVAMQRTLESALPLLEFDPKQAAIFKTDEWIRAHMDVLGGPSKILRTPEELAEKLEAMQKAEQQAQQLAALQQGAAAAKDGAAAMGSMQQAQQGAQAGA